MKRFDAHAMELRLTKKGFLYLADLTWLDKRKSELQNYGRSRMPLTMVAELDAIERIEAIVFLPCNGEAHSNAFIDNCWTCMPRWGVVINWQKVHHECVSRLTADGNGAYCKFCGKTLA